MLWLAGSAAAVAVAWTGVGVVDDDLVDPAPATDLPAATTPERAATTLVPEATLDSSTPTSEPSPTSEPTVSPVAEVDPTATPDEPIPEATSTLEPQPAPQPTAGPQPPTPTSIPAPTPLPTPTSPPPTPTPESAQTLTFNLVGGSTQISFSPSAVTVLWATPNPGFEVEIEPETPGIKVEFEADHHESRVDAWWSDGPEYDIREKPKD